MAINKNFVIKNGVQVSTDLIIGDTDTNKVGIGTTVPHYDLHVGVARGSRGGIGVTDAVVAGVATINQLSVTGISTFAGALDVNSTVDFAGDVVFNGTNDITYDQSESALVFNDGAAIRVGTGSDLSIMHDGSNSILRDNGTGGIKILGSQVEIGAASVNETMAKFTENGNVELYHDNTKHFEVVAVGATVFGDFIVSGVTTSKELNVSSGSTFGDDLNVGFTTFFVDKSTGFIGVGTNVPTATLEIGKTAGTGIGVSIHENGNAGFTGIVTVGGLIDGNGGAHIDNLRLGIDADNDITTSSGNLTLDSAGGTVQVNDNLTVDGLIDGNGGASIDNVQIGVTGDNEIDTSTLNLILDSAGGTINIDDNITVAGVSTFSGIGSFGTDMNVGITTFFVDKSTGRIGIGTNVPTAALEIGKTAGTGIGVSIFENGNAAFSGIVTVGGNLNVTGDIVYDEVNGRNLNISGVATVADLGVTGLSTAENFRVGYGASIHEHGGASFAGIVTFGNSILPNADNAVDLGATGTEFKDLFIDGTANIDSLVADTADINGGTVDAANIGASTPGTGAFTTLSATTSATVGTAATIQVGGQAAFAGIVTANGGLSVGSNGSAGVAVSAYTNGNFAASGIATVGGALLVGAGVTVGGDILPDADGSRDLGSSTKEFQDLFIDGTANIDALAADSAAIGDLTADRVVIAGTSGELEDDANFTYDGSILKIAAGAGASIHNTGNAAFVGVVTAGRGFAIGIQSASLDVAKNVGISTLNFIGAGNTFKVTGQTLDISIAGGGGGGGGVTAVETAVSSTSATSTGTFAKATYRSAAVIAQITQGSAYQVGRYLVIHDGTTVTTVEESAVATGSMLGTFEGVINGDNVEFRVTMSSSSSATVTTKIDTVDIP